MSVDVDAVLRIGWIVPYDDAVNYFELAEEDFEALNSIDGVGDGYKWVSATNCYVDKPDIAIGWQPDFRKQDPDGKNPWDTVPLTTEEFAAQLHDPKKDEAARKVYEAVTGRKPESDPMPMLYERWW